MRSEIRDLRSHIARAGRRTRRGGARARPAARAPERRRNARRGGRRARGSDTLVLIRQQRPPGSAAPNSPSLRAASVQARRRRRRARAHVQHVCPDGSPRRAAASAGGAAAGGGVCRGRQSKVGLIIWYVCVCLVDGCLERRGRGGCCWVLPTCLASGRRVTAGAGGVAADGGAGRGGELKAGRSGAPRGRGWEWLSSPFLGHFQEPGLARGRHSAPLHAPACKHSICARTRAAPPATVRRPLTVALGLRAHTLEGMKQLVEAVKSSGLLR